MRFERMEVPAFGPFTGLVLDFPQGEAGADLHVLYGPNEAGKSSLLRAMGDLLFGVPVRSGDDFLHKAKDLRIGATVRGRDGAGLTFFRRKGNKDTLLAADGTALPDGALAGWLGPVDRGYFTTMFGLTADQLREGGRELLAGRGDLGRALFSASLGGTPVHRVLESLDGEARRIFNGRAVTGVSIRPAVKAYEEAEKAAKQAAVAPDEWGSAQAAVKEAETALGAVAEEMARRQARLEVVKRCLDALPALAGLRAREEALGGLPALPEVGGGFVTEAREARVGRRAAEAEVARLADELKALEEQLAACVLRAEVLAAEGEIEALHGEMSLHREQRARLAKAGAEAAALEPGLRSGLVELGVAGGLEVAAGLRMTLAEQQELKAAAAELEAARRAVEQATGQSEAQERAAELVAGKLAALGEAGAAAGALERLREAHAAAGPAVEAGRTLAAAERELKKMEAELEAQMRRLRGTTVSAEAAAALPVPARAAIRQAGALRAELEARLAAVKKEAEAAAKTERRAERELAALQRRRALPGQADLAAVRVKRDALRQAERGMIYKPGGQLAEAQAAHDAAVEAADEVADLLRTEAEAVAKVEQLRDEAAAVKEALEEVGRVEAAVVAALEAWETGWRKLWQACGVEPELPEVMLEWHEDWVKAAELTRRVQLARQETAERRDLMAAAASGLEAALGGGAGRAFSVLEQEAARRLSLADQEAGARASLEQQRDEVRRELERWREGKAAREAKAAAVLEKWEAVCAKAGLSGGMAVAHALELLERRRRVADLFDRWQTLRQEASGLAEATMAWEARVKRTASALALPDGPVDGLESALWQALGQARTARTTHERLTREIAALRMRHREKTAALSLAQQQMAAVLAAAGVETEEALEPVLAGLEERARLVTGRDQQREILHTLARGEALGSFLERLSAEDPAQMGPECGETEAALRDLAARRDECLRTADAARRRLAELESATDAAAAHRQEAENLAARLAHDSARYVRLRLATHWLSRQIEQFRQEHQGPLMRRAGELFSRLTLGAFDGLDTAWSGDDTPDIVARRGTVPVAVDQLSEGTRDQLFLSLRLAALESHFASHEPLPLVLDDLLMTFDDARSSALLPVLAALSRQTQVLVFTHHEHVLDLCRSALPEGAWTAHRLERAGG